MISTVPLTLSSAYLDTYTPVINTNPFLPSVQYTTDGDLYKTVVHPNPIKTYISPLGTAIHNDDPVVFHHKYHEFKSPDKSSKNITLSVSSPAILSPTMLPLNTDSVKSDPELKKRMTAYFYEKTMNDWLRSDDYENLLKYFTVKNKKVSIVNSEKEFLKNEPNSNIDEKIDFIADNVMTKYDMKSFLKKFVLKKDISWFHLRDHKKYVKRAIYKKIKKNIKKMIVH